MAKYDPLNTYLKRQRAARLELTFREIENLIGYLLPKRAGKSAWWTGEAAEPTRAVQLCAWRDAGYGASLSVGSDKVTFSRP